MVEKNNNTLNSQDKKEAFKKQRVKDGSKKEFSEANKIVKNHFYMPKKPSTVKKEKQDEAVISDENVPLNEEETVVATETPSILTKEDYKRITKLRKKKTWSLKNAKRYRTMAKKGLTTKQVKERIENGYINLIDDKNTKTYFNIFFTNICTFFNLLCFVVAGALIAVGAFDNIFFIFIVLSNMLIGIVQEIRAKHTIERISLVTAPTANVVRDGVLQEIHVNDVVLDDVLEFTLGKQVCADSIILEGEVEVNESNLTGESEPVKKSVGDKLLSGSFILSGSCFARADAVGNDNYSAQLASKAKQYKKPQSELLNSLRIIIKVIGIAIIPLGILMLHNNFGHVGADAEAIKKTAGSIIGMIPAGMFLLTSVALAVGVIKLSKKRTLVQDLYSIEMLSRVNMLCLDKTGTITDGTMKVANTYLFDKNVTDEQVESVISSMMVALGNNNATSQALISHFGSNSIQKAVATLPFSSARKLSAVSFSHGSTYVIGAPEFVLNQVPERMADLITECTNLGQRVLVLAKGRGKIVDETLPSELKAVALITIEDRIRDDAEKTLEWFKKNDVGIKIISGDDPVTVSVISKRVGVPNAERYINLYGMNDAQVVAAANKYTVFGRVTPEQKALLVKALKQNGHKVAMTGDGVNDILALKEADCSIAMASGSEATRNVSNLVLLNSNFSSMPSIVGEGRRVINNITKSSSLFLMKTAFTIFLTVFVLLLNIAYPFSPNQVMLLEFFAIGIPSFFLALQPNKEPIKGRFLINLISKALPGGVLLFICFVSCYLFDTLVGTGTQYETMASLAIAFGGLVLLYRICRPIDAYRLILFIACVVLTIGTLLIIPPTFFDYVELDLTSLLFVFIAVEFGFLWLIKPIEKIKEKEEDENQEEKNIIRLRGNFEDSPQLEKEERAEDIVEEKNNQIKSEEKRAVKNG